jgi:tyrosinase
MAGLSQCVMGLVLAALVVSGCGATAQPAAPMSGQIVAAASGVKLAAENTRVALSPNSGAGNLRGQLAELAPQRALFLILDDLRAAQQPGIIYEIYLGLPAEAAPSADDPHYVGTLNFFGVAPPNTARQSRSYNVTAVIRRLLSQGLPGDGLAVTIVGNRQGAASDAAPPSIGRIALVAQ